LRNAMPLNTGTTIDANGSTGASCQSADLLPRDTLVQF
jgi:hypothetical protein